MVFQFIEEQYPSTPASSPLVLCLTRRCGFTGRLSSKEETHDTILDGSSTILKLFGICDGNENFNRLVRMGVDKCMSRERESETSFSSPANHCEYRHAFAWRMRLARWRAAMSFTVVSTSFSSSSLKFDLRNQPFAVVLSPMDRIHDSGCTWPSSIFS